MKTETTIDKSGWGAGPWQDEPDKANWIDEATGLDCMIVRTEHSGALCGYVGVPPGHPLHGKDYGHEVAPPPDRSRSGTGRTGGRRRDDRPGG